MNIDRARAFFDRSVFRPDIPQQPRCFTVGYLNGDGLEKGEYSLCGAAAADEVSGVTPVTALHSFLPTLTSLLPPSSSSTRSPHQPPFDSNTWQCTPPGHSHTLTTLVGPPTDPFWRRAQAAVAPAVTVGCRTHVGLNCWIFRLTAEAKGHLTFPLRYYSQLEDESQETLLSTTTMQMVEVRRGDRTKSAKRTVGSVIALDAPFSVELGLASGKEGLRGFQSSPNYGGCSKEGMELFPYFAAVAVAKSRQNESAYLPWRIPACDFSRAKQRIQLGGSEAVARNSTTRYGPYRGYSLVREFEPLMKHKSVKESVEREIEATDGDNSHLFLTDFLVTSLEYGEAVGVRLLHGGRRTVGRTLCRNDQANMIRRVEVWRKKASTTVSEKLWGSETVRVERERADSDASGNPSWWETTSRICHDGLIITSIRVSRVRLPDWVADGDQTSVVLWLSIVFSVLLARAYNVLFSFFLALLAAHASISLLATARS
ncbi:hypothetical protein FB45DRAFT_1084871 [Roridomyces roridus]|uniref:Uncharacterized protein n=1 Tax=Roridomyces roridus TaxID=1738132 RepID=A0AAD7FL52_9AGAR|nr:hypothetical protein FB45DRAFT_1084871 [Roridomyces roridus]